MLQLFGFRMKRVIHEPEIGQKETYTLKHREAKWRKYNCIALLNEEELNFTFVEVKQNREKSN